MKTTYKDYLKFIFFILFLALTITLFNLSFKDSGNSRDLMFTAVFTSIFTAMFSDSVTDITIALLYNKAKMKYPKQMINSMRVIKYSGQAAGYFQVSILLLSTMLFYSTLIDSIALMVFCLLLGSGTLSLLVRKMVQTKHYLFPDQLPK